MFSRPSPFFIISATRTAAPLPSLVSVGRRFLASSQLRESSTSSSGSVHYWSLHRCRIRGRMLMCLSLFLAAEFGGSWFRFRVLGMPRLSSIMMERLIEGSLGVDDLGEKFRVLEKGLERFGFDGEIWSCGTKNSTWKIDQVHDAYDPKAFLWFKSVQTANKEAEEQDKRDGYM